MTPLLTRFALDAEGSYSLLQPPRDTSLTGGIIMEKCTKFEKNKSECPCKSTACERHGTCCDCISWHRKSGSAVACMRADALE